MLHRTGSLLLLVLLANQGYAADAPKPPDNSGPQHVQPAAPGPSATKSDIPADANGAAMRVYRDPVTGEFTAPPPEVKKPDVPAPFRESVSTEPAPDLQETAIQGGGTMIHLQGRFRSYLSATKDSEGKITVHCNDKPAANLQRDKRSEK